MLAEYLHQHCGVRSEEAVGRALAASADMNGSGTEVDRRTVQRMRNRYKSCGDSLLGLPDALRMKYPKFKE